MKRVNAAICYPIIIVYLIAVFISSSSAAYILHPTMAIKRRSSSRNSTKNSSSLAGSSSYENKNNNDDNNKQNKKQKVVVTAIKRKRHWTRPGVEAAARLVSLLPPLSSSSSSSSFPSLFSEQEITNDTVNSWNMALSCYTTMLKVKGGTKLYNLDQQRDGIGKQWKLNASNNSNNKEDDDDEEEVPMTKDQLLNIIIPWKFLKGKPRNALKPLLQSNSEEEVIRCCKAAFQFADKLIDENNNTNDNSNNNEQYIQESIQSICNLKGVGPATASAILSIYHPQHFCFMDDEIIECLYDKKRGYTLKIYMEVNERCAEIARLLNECCSSGEYGGKGGGEGNELWTPASVGKALWTVATMSAQNDEEGLNRVFND